MSIPRHRWQAHLRELEPPVLKTGRRPQSEGDEQDEQARLLGQPGWAGRGQQQPKLRKGRGASGGEAETAQTAVRDALGAAHLRKGDAPARNGAGRHL